MNPIDISPEGRPGNTVVRRWGPRIGVAAAVAVLIQALVLLTIWMFGLQDVALEGFMQDAANPTALLLGEALVIAPLLETLVMGWLIALMLERGWDRWVAIIASAMFAAACHQWIRPLGWIVVFAFLAYSYLYIERNRKCGDGYIVAALTHFFYNALGCVGFLGVHAAP